MNFIASDFSFLLPLSISVWISMNFHGICVIKLDKISKSIYIRNTSNGTKMSCLRSVSSIGSYWHPFLGICCLHSFFRFCLHSVYSADAKCIIFCCYWCYCMSSHIQHLEKDFAGVV